jgi:hypothetical protein
MMRNSIILFLFLFAGILDAAEYHEQNSLRLPKISSWEVQKLIGFFSLKYIDDQAECPQVSLKSKDLYTFSGTTGIHRVLWQGNDSLHNLRVFVKEKKGIFRYEFKFTLSPPAHKQQTDLCRVFQGKKLTQYYIWRIKAGPGNKIQDIIIRSETDPLSKDNKKNERSGLPRKNSFRPERK